MNIILNNLNTYINKMKGNYALKEIKRLFNEDFVVLTINNKELKKLRSNTKQVGALESNTKVVIQTYGIMINGVKIADFDMTNKDQAIKYIKVLNTDIKGLKGIDIK